MSFSLALLATALAGSALAVPVEQAVFRPAGIAVPTLPDGPHTVFDPLHHLSALSPFYIPASKATPLPYPTCNVTTTSILIRHSAIKVNDEDYEQFIEAFVDKVSEWDNLLFPQPPAGWSREDEIKRWKKEGTYDGDVSARKWWFLKDWEAGVSMDDAEVLSDRGKDDSFAFGRFVHDSYPHLFPAPHLGKKHRGKKPEIEMVEYSNNEVMSKKPKDKHHHKDKKGHQHKDNKKNKKDGKKRPSKDPKNKKPAPPYKLWTASSQRDIDTATSFIKGAFPRNQTGKGGTGDGYHVQLVKVPNKLGSGWKRSLTPHKACDAFDKKPSLEPASQWLGVFAPKIRERLASVVPTIAKELEDDDIMAMSMLCAYETITQGWSGFCGVFNEEEWRDIEYYFDVRFHYMMGYGNALSPVLGAPWVKTARHLLAGEVEDDQDGDGKPDEPGHGGMSKRGWFKKNGKGKPGDGLPEPKLPPNGTHSQLLHTFFTHRESPAFTSTILNLYNSSDASLGPAAGLAPPLDHRPEPRQWRTSELVAFLGHIALERFSCDEGADVGSAKADGDEEDGAPSFVRVMVNGQQANMHGCDDGPGGSCAWADWKIWMDERLERWSDWDTACTKEEEKDD